MVAMPKTMQPPRNRAPDADQSAGSAPRSTVGGVSLDHPEHAFHECRRATGQERLDECLDEDERGGDQQSEAQGDIAGETKPAGSFSTAWRRSR